MANLNLAIVVCSDVIGGHEHQVAELVKSISEKVSVTLIIDKSHISLFSGLKVRIKSTDRPIFKRGSIVLQYWYGWRYRQFFQDLFKSYDRVIVAAGTVEAGIAVGFALYGCKPIYLYLPFFYNRVPEWGVLGHIYNFILIKSCQIFDQIITINKIQASYIRKNVKIPAMVVPNKVRYTAPGISNSSPPRLIFVGRLDKQKRIPELIEWLDEKSNPFSKIIFIGDGPLRGELERISKEATYIKSEFLGWLNPSLQDKTIFKNDILIINSLQEGEPLVIREARLRGMRILARDILGIRGVTKYHERFKTKSELLNKLYAISKQSSDDKNNISADLINRVEDKRELYINKLVNTFR